MTKFLILYRSTMSVREQLQSMTPEQSKANMDAWMGWAQKSGPALADMGEPVGDSAMLKGMPGREHVNAYSIVRAESLEMAKRMFDSHPHFDAPGASIEVLELMSAKDCD